VPRVFRLVAFLTAGMLALGYWQVTRSPERGAATGAVALGPGDAAEAGRYPASLPPEAIATLEAIERGGPYPYERDGTVFQNREGRLPAGPQGYYREYTVSTPGARDRGARRIVAGGRPPEVFYYTDDHYRTFRRLEVQR
jgi:ribonuclease T1